MEVNIIGSFLTYLLQKKIFVPNIVISKPPLNACKNMYNFEKSLENVFWATGLIIM